MDSASLKSFIPILDGIDRWIELAPLLPIIIILELVLSADNAVALASITKRLNNPNLQTRALNIGVFLSLILRITLIFAASYIIKIKAFQLIASFYLFSLVYNYFTSKDNTNLNNQTAQVENTSLLNVVFLLAVTDLAFSIDSLTAAVAISDQVLLVITGGIVGIVALRFTSGLFISWLEKYTFLEDAGFFAVSLVALKLLIHCLIPSLSIPEYIFFVLLATVFIWGFSQKSSPSDSSQS